MEWPFVRRSKYEEVRLERDDNYLKSLELEYENQSLTEDIGKLLNDINRLNQELANELNSHRETKESLNREALRLSNTIDKLEKEFKETKDALKIAQEETRQHRMTIDFADEKEEKIKQYLIKVINYI